MSDILLDLFRPFLIVLLMAVSLGFIVGGRRGGEAAATGLVRLLGFVLKGAVRLATFVAESAGRGRWGR